MNKKTHNELKRNLIVAFLDFCNEYNVLPHIGSVHNIVSSPDLKQFGSPIQDGKDFHLIQWNVSYTATNALDFGEEYLSFDVRIGGIKKSIFVPYEDIHILSYPGKMKEGLIPYLEFFNLFSEEKSSPPSVEKEKVEKKVEPPPQNIKREGNIYQFPQRENRLQ